VTTHSIVELTEANFDEQVLNSRVPVLVDFWGEGCGPCKMLAPVLHELALEYADRARIAQLKADEHPVVATRFRITSLPTVLLFEQGEPTQQLTGLRSKSQYKASLDKALS
jgi:thioredoxin 1